VLPHLANVALDEVERVADELWLRVRVRAERVSCPRCLAGSSRVHGRYRRRLIDTALGGLRVVVELVVRRFRCAEPGCAVVTLPAATRPSATTCARCARPAAPRPRRPRHRRSAQCPAGSSPTPTRLDADDTAALKKILERSPPLAATAAHVTGFAEMLLERHGNRLDAWITTVEADDQPDLHRFTHGLRRDHAAVLAGLTEPHSSGIVEGNVNRIKTIKDRCTAAPASTYSANASYSPDDQGWGRKDHKISARSTASRHSHPGDLTPEAPGNLDGNPARAVRCVARAVQSRNIRMLEELAICRRGAARVRRCR
jgi:transposase